MKATSGYTGRAAEYTHAAPGSGRMRMVLSVLLVVVVFTPLALVSFLFAEAYSPAMDRFTMGLPIEVRSTVASIAMNRAQDATGKDHDARLQRVVKLDPRNAEARGAICTTSINPMTPTAAEDCRIAVEVDPGQWTYNALAMTQERAGDPCTAEDTFTRASNYANGRNAFILKNMGRAAYECGRYPYSIAEFSAAEAIDSRTVAGDAPDDDDLDDDRRSLQLDREWLTLAFTAGKQPAQAAQSCQKAHPELKSCTCVVTQEEERGAKAAEPVCTGPAAPGAAK